MTNDSKAKPPPNVASSDPTEAWHALCRPKWPGDCKPTRREG